MALKVLASPEGIERLVKGSTIVIEQPRVTRPWGTVDTLDWWHATTCTSKQPLAQADTAEELKKWAKRCGARRTEVL